MRLPLHDTILGSVAKMARSRRWLLLATLMLLHLTVMSHPVDLAARTLFLGHLGLFLLWQPLVGGERRLGARGLAATLVALGLATWWLGPWLLIVWVMFLGGLVGGRSFLTTERRPRLFYLVAFAYLLTLLLGILLPRVLPVEDPGIRSLESLMLLELPLAFLAMAWLARAGEAAPQDEVIDFVTGLFVFLLLAVLGLGTLAFKLIAELDYVSALLLTLLTMGGILLLISWAWNPRAGFTGLGVFFTRYVLSIAMPYERWLAGLAEFAQQEDDPDRFLGGALKRLQSLPWVEGGRWTASGRHDAFGRLQGHASEYRHAALELCLWTRQPLSAGLVWHFNLLVQLLGEFYLAKQRGADLQALSYMRAVHETGARLTHDVKNLLQSLNTLCFACARETDAASPALQAMMRRQLPIIAERLQLTLDKLKRPEDREELPGPLGRCLKDFEQRYGAQGVVFRNLDRSGDATVPCQALAGILDNLLGNALNKRVLETGIGIEFTLESVRPLALSVSDAGSAMDTALAARVLHEPVLSDNGLGIGLYQSALLAQRCGWRLSLAENRDGCVRFRLAAQAPLPVPS